MKKFAYIILPILALTVSFFKIKSSINESNLNCFFLKNINIYSFSSDQFLTTKALLMKDGKIEKIFSDSVPDYDLHPDSCRILDMSGHYAIPGLIDAHTHLLASDLYSVTGWRQALELSASRPDMMRILMGEKNALTMLKRGFTSFRDLGNSGYFLDSKLEQLLKKKYRYAPEIIYSGPGLAISPTQINLKLNPNEYQLIDNESDVNLLSYQYKKNNARWIKIYADNSGEGFLIHASLLNRLVSALQESNFKISVHAETPESIKNALLSFPDSLEHFYNAPLDSETFHQIEKKPYIVITDVDHETCKKFKFIPNCDEKLVEQKKRIEFLKNNQFKLVFGSDAILQYSSQSIDRGSMALNSLINLSYLGFNGPEILRMATLNAAQMLELNSGRIEEGFDADILVFSENPIVDLNILKNPTAIFSNGYAVCKTNKECLR